MNDRNFCPQCGEDMDDVPTGYRHGCGILEKEFLAEEMDTGLPPGWENAPLSAQVAFLVSDGDPDLFDQIKAELKGE